MLALESPQWCCIPHTHRDIEPAVVLIPGRFQLILVDAVPHVIAV